jgi:hypothetical protein
MPLVWPDPAGRCSMTDQITIPRALLEQALTVTTTKETS